MKFVLDTHTHTIASGHAYNTLQEMALKASEKQLEMLAITEHGMAMPGTCHEYYFHNLWVVPRDMFGVKLLLGVEANIMDYKGSLDLDEYTLKRMDLVIASAHGPCLPHGTKEENTEAILGAIRNPYVHIIGHPDDGRYALDYEAIVKEAKKYGVMLELNNSSQNPNGYRQNCRENATIYLELCKQYEVMISLGSDAHVANDILNYNFATKLLEEINFPEELIANVNSERFLSIINKRNALVNKPLLSLR